MDRVKSIDHFHKYLYKREFITKTDYAAILATTVKNSEVAR